MRRETWVGGLLITVSLTVAVALHRAAARESQLRRDAPDERAFAGALLHDEDDTGRAEDSGPGSPERRSQNR